MESHSRTATVRIWSAGLMSIRDNVIFTNLFIGFDQAMFYSNNNVFLFVETSRKTGVTNLIGLAMASPAMRREWMGWIFLENLSFTEFRAFVACLLETSLQMGQFRNFTRPGGFERGEGVFWLDAGFTNVPGIRLSSCNRSPQSLGPYEATYPERNANFIEVRFLTTSWRGLQPGDTIKIAGGLWGFGWL